MLIILTEMPSKQEIYFDAAQIRCITDDKSNLLCCQVITNVMTPAGYMSFICLGNKADIARQVNSAREGRNPLAH